MTTLLAVELGVLGPLQVRQGGMPIAIPGAKPRALLTMLGLQGGSVVSADTLLELLWGDDPPRTAGKALQTHISSLRRTLGDGVVLTEGAGWTLAGTDIDALRYKTAAKLARDAAAAGDTSQAVTRFDEALALWRGTPELPDGQRGSSEKTRWIEAHAALVEDRADALLVTGRAAEIVGELEAAVADAPLRERRWGQLMLALYRAGRQGEALAAYRRARTLLADQLGVDPGPDLRRLEAAIVAQDAALDTPVAQQASSVTRAVTFLLTDIEGSTAAWEADSDAMAAALARHDELIEQVVTSRGGRLIKTRGEGDATFSVFERPSGAAAAAVEMQEAMVHEPWPLRDPLRIRVALHTGEVEIRDGDYFGRAVNRAARLRSLASGGQILCSGATAELVIDSLHDDVVLADLGMRQLRNLARPEHVFELRLETTEDSPEDAAPEQAVERPELPAVLTGAGPFVGRGRELAQLLSAWQTALTGAMGAVLIAGEPGVGKTRLAGEWSRQAHDQGAIVLYGRCDEDLGAPYQPFAEALRSLVPCLNEKRLRGLRGVEALLPLVPVLTDVLPDLAAPTRADPDTERYALFDAVVALLEVASASAPVVLVLDDLHWAAKPTLLLLRHLLRFGDRARLQVVGTYRSTDLDRSHPLAAMLADLHRDGTAERIALSGLDEDDVTTYVAEAGYDDEELARALASVTGGNPFFLIEALRHVDESGGVWDQNTLPQGVREAVSRRLSRLPVATNKALAAAAVVGSRFSVDLVERVVDQDLVDAFDEACKAGIVIEEPGGHYRFNHALVRQSLLAELPSVRRMRLHQRIATTLESEPGADDDLLADLAHHYFECAWAGNAAKAVEYCRRAADQAMARLAYEGAADLYDHALHALEELDDELPDRDDQTADLLLARCEALLAAGDMASAPDAVAQLQAATLDSPRLAAWATCFDGELSMFIHPERLNDVESAVATAAEKLAELDDAAGEAKAHTVRAGCLGRLGRIGDCEIALDHALSAARRAREHRRVNAVLANAPLAALWGPNPVPRAGGRCLDVVRLLRITTDSPAVEATSTRCQAVLEAFRGRASAARRMIDSARRTVTELGLRHALMEVEQFAGIVEMVVDEPVAAEQCLRKAYNGFRRMRLDADTAETAALLGRVCLLLGRDAEADELCSESERLAGHALKPSIAWRTLRAQLLSRRGDHDEARRFAEAAVSLAEPTDGLVDHGDACLALARVLDAAGDAAGARAAAERAAGLYELKGAGALAEKVRGALSESAERASAAAALERPVPDLVNACTRVGERVISGVNRQDWQEVEAQFAPRVSVESRRKIVGFSPICVPAAQWPLEMRRYFEAGMEQFRHEFVAIRGDRLALVRLEAATADPTPGAPRDEMLQVIALNDDGLIVQQVWFDVDDIDAAIAELDAGHAQFEGAKLAAHRLGNAASRAAERFCAHFADRDEDALTQIVATDISLDDRRQIVGSGRRQGRDAVLMDFRESAAWGVLHVTPAVVATRGDRVALIRTRYQGQDRRPEASVIETLHVAEIDDDGRIVELVTLEPDDIDAAFQELEARYLAGEASAHAQVWTILTTTFAALNQHDLSKLPATTSGYHIDDHRLHATIGGADLTALFRTTWELTPDLYMYIEAVHRLDDLGVVITQSSYGTTQDGTDAQWRMIQLLTVDGALGDVCEVFHEADLEAALARFDELHPRERVLENAASRVAERYLSHFPSRDWDKMAASLADEFWTDDRRHVVNSGVVRGGREFEIHNVQVIAEFGCTNITSTPIATRGDRLLLAHHDFTFDGPAGVRGEMIDVIEINAKNQLVSHVVFDRDDIDAAFAELDSRFLAGEASAHAPAWAAVSESFAALNRHELPDVPSDLVAVDHRQGPSIASDELMRFTQAGWELAPDRRMHIETVHKLSDLGAVITLAVKGTSQQGFEADWRIAEVLVMNSAEGNRVEVFEERDLDAALARFDELHPHERQLENAASQSDERFTAYFAARDWVGMEELLTEDFTIDDRRRVVNMGIRSGRDVGIANVRAVADVGFTDITSTVVATRGARLALSRERFSGRDEHSEAFYAEVLGIVEINTENQIAARIVFDLDDIDAAFAELDARYAAGRAAAQARTWSVITDVYAALNRNEMPAIAADLHDRDHRRIATIDSGDMVSHVRAALDLTNSTAYMECVHRVTDRGVVATHVARGTTADGFQADWRMIELLMVEGDVLSRCEIFDEDDLDTALARFDELHPQQRRLENAATQVAARYATAFTSGDWDTVSKVLAEDVVVDDRRSTVNAGVTRGRDAEIKDQKVAAELGFADATWSAVAIRGDCLVLTQSRYSDHDSSHEPFVMEMLHIIQTDARGQMTAVIVFDVDDIAGALEELDARYAAGDAAVHASTWSTIAEAYAALNRHEMPALTYDWADHDHRRVAAIGTGDLMAYIRATLEVTDATIYPERAHRLTDLGAVVTHVAQGTTEEGFQAEWRMIAILLVDNGRLSRCEIFDEDDLDTALARFEELHPQKRRLENAAIRAGARYAAAFESRDWQAVSELTAQDFSIEDRRNTINAGVRQGRDAEVKDLQAAADVGFTDVDSFPVATRGEHIHLSRVRFFRRDEQTEPFANEVLMIVEVDGNERMASVVVFDIHDTDAAFAELDTRYIAGGAANHAAVWSAITNAFSAFNRRELPQTTTDFVDIDHRRGGAFASGELMHYLRAGWELNNEIKSNVETVHRLNEFGAVVTHAASLNSREGFEAEWRSVDLIVVRDGMLSRSEIFDETDLDTALARFDELQARERRLENAASRVYERFWACYADRDWDAAARMLTSDHCSDDKRKVVGAGIRHGRDAMLEDMKAAAAQFGALNTEAVVVATRGDRLALRHARITDRDQRAGAFESDVLNIVEIDNDQRIASLVWFDPDDFYAAIAELDARYITGEAAAYAGTWSVISRAQSAVDSRRRKLLPTKTDWVSIDHRRGIGFGPGDIEDYIRVFFNSAQESSAYIECVHRLDDRGVVFVYVLKGSTPEGFDAEWRIAELVTVEGDLISRVEHFDEVDLGGAIAKFDDIRSPTARPSPPQNAATRAGERFRAQFAARDWQALAEMFAVDFFTDDRRRVVNAGVRHGRDAQIADLKTSAAIGITYMTFDVIATRGERLMLGRGDAGNAERPGAVAFDVLQVVEIDAAGTMTRVVTFDTDDIDAAFEELDARYVAGEAASCADTWSTITEGYAALNRHELGPIAHDWASTDNRRAVSFAPGDLLPYLRAGRDVTPDGRIYIESVLRLSSVGAVVTHVTEVTSKAGFDAESRGIAIITVADGELKRLELFDESDVAAALAQFEEVQPQTPRLENAATDLYRRFTQSYTTRDWDAIAHTVAPTFYIDDRRQTVNAGIERGRDAVIENMRATADPGNTNVTSAILATRGARLILTSADYASSDQGPEAFRTEVLSVVESDTDDRLAALVVFDRDDIDAAYEELDARYLTGEAADHARTWATISTACTSFNRHELPAADWVNVDHRRSTPFTSNDLNEAIRAAKDLTPDLTVRVEAVHRLESFGAVVTNASQGTSRDGVRAEWRMIQVLIVEGDRVARCELFDEADIDAAVTRFEELRPRRPRMDTAAIRTVERCQKCFATQDWDAMAEIVASDIATEDRRGVVNAGTRHGRAAEIENMRAIVDLSVAMTISDVIATRGERVVLMRMGLSIRDQVPGAFAAESLVVLETDLDGCVARYVVFDRGDIDAAFAELDARYLAGEGSAYARTWSTISDACTAVNRREMFPTTSNWVNMDHRVGASFAAGDLTAIIESSWDSVVPDIKIYVEAVHRLSRLGVVVTGVAKGISHEGFGAEWRSITLATVDGDLVSRAEIFDEADLDAAIAQFEELERSAPHLDNASTRTWALVTDLYNRRDVESALRLLATEGKICDLRKGLRAELVGEARQNHLRVLFELSPDGWQIEVTPIAIRGSRLSLTRLRWIDTNLADRPITNEALAVTEVGDDGQMQDSIVFDPDDLDAALAELDARYLAGEAAGSTVWANVTQAYAAMNRREIFSTTEDFVDIDHRLVSIESGELRNYILATWKDVSQLSRMYVKAVHRLSEFGAVVSHKAQAISRDGLDAEWHVIAVIMFEGGLLSRCEFFDEADLDAALTRFEELHTQKPRLDNAATRIWTRMADAYNRRDVEGWLSVLSSDGAIYDRRRGLGSVSKGLAKRKFLQAILDVSPNSWRLHPDPIAIRGSRLSFTHARWSDIDDKDRPTTIEGLLVVEVDDTGLVRDAVVFDPNDIDAAFAELDARFLAGEAVGNELWAEVSQNYCAMNRHEVPDAMSSWATIDHRVRESFEGGDLTAYTKSAWDLMPDASFRIEAVHRLKDLGAVATHVAYGTSLDGFEAEWRMIMVLVVQTEGPNRCELFNEADLDAALARFDELLP